MPTRAAAHHSRTRTRSARLTGAACAALAFAGAAQAQDRDIERRIEQRMRYADPLLAESDAAKSFAEKVLIDVGGFYSFTFLHLNDDTGNSRRLLQYDATVYARASWDNAHTAFARTRFRYRDFSPGDSFDERGDSWLEPFLDRYWYELDLRDPTAIAEDNALAFNIRAGRQFVDWGAGLTLSEVLYAVRPAISLGPRVTAEALIGITPSDESVIDFDASRSKYNSDTERAFFGGMVRASTDSGKTFYAYYLVQDDRNGPDSPRLPIPLDVDFAYNSQYLGLGSYGSIGTQLTYEAELVLERGTSQSDPLRDLQREENIQAFAARGQLTYLFADANQSRVQFESLFASGDRDRLVSTDTVGGNLAGTTDNGFNSLGFANTGLAFAPSFSNVMVFRLGGSTLPFADRPPFAQLQVGMDVLLFAKMEEDGPIDEPTYNRSFLGVETDFYLNYRITSDLSLGLRYGAFFPGSAIAGDRDVRHFVLLGVTLSF
jgi:hypothetical protein